LENSSIPSPKAYDGYKLSYARSTDSKLKKAVIRGLERLTGRPKLQAVYDQLHENGPDPWKVWGESLDILNIQVDYDKRLLENVPLEGPVIFVANHPYGIVDGIIFLYLVSQVRKDYFLLINEVLSHEPIMKGHLLPVDFRTNEEAKHINLNTRRETTERLKAGQALVIFPSGAVSTQPRFSLFSPAEEWPWRTFICSRIHETQCTVVPLYFHGQNSFWFQLVSKFSMNMRLGLLLFEALNKRNKTIKVEIGNPIPYAEMADIRNRKKLIDYLKERTLALKEESE